MRLTRKLILAGLAAMVAMAFAAASASAIEVTAESTGAHCSAASTITAHGSGSGGCLLRGTGTGVELGGPFGFMTTCNDTFEGRVGENGEGFVYAAQFQSCSPINVTPCVEVGQFTNWKAELATGTENPITSGPFTASETNFETHFCVVALGQTIRCHLNMTVSEPQGHRYSLTTGATHKFCEDGTNSVQGTFTQVIDAAHPAIEIKG
jgi:hypothetical protein